MNTLASLCLKTSIPLYKGYSTALTGITSACNSIAIFLSPLPNGYTESSPTWIRCIAIAYNPYIRLLRTNNTHACILDCYACISKISLAYHSW